MVTGAAPATTEHSGGCPTMPVKQKDGEALKGVSHELKGKQGNSPSCRTSADKLGKNLAVKFHSGRTELVINTMATYGRGRGRTRRAPSTLNKSQNNALECSAHHSEQEGQGRAS